MARLSLEDFEHLARELTSLSRSGLPLPAGLAHLAGALPAGRLQATARELSELLGAGIALPEALGRLRHAVPAEVVALAACAERGVPLDEALAFSVDHARRLRRLRSSLFLVVVYPLILAMACLGLVWLVSYSLVPRFEEIFQQLGAELPFLTQMVINGAALVRTWVGTVLLLMLILPGVLFVLSGRVRDWVFGVVGRLPGLDMLMHVADTAILARFISLLGRRGVPLPEILDIAALGVYHPATRRDITRMSEAAAKGQPTAEHLPLNTPSTAAFLYREGEARGDLAETCEGIAQYCEDRYERLGRQSVAFLEPLLVVLVTVVGVFMVISLNLPLFSITKFIGR
jgi:type II secretory pathway component PulF